MVALLVSVRFDGGFASSGETRRVCEMKGEMGEVLKKIIYFGGKKKKNYVEK